MKFRFIPYTPNHKPLHDSFISIVTTASIKQKEHPPDGDECATAGISYREIAKDVSPKKLEVKTKVPNEQFDIRANQEDINTVFPIERLQELADQKIIGGGSQYPLFIQWS